MKFYAFIFILVLFSCGSTKLIEPQNQIKHGIVERSIISEDLQDTVVSSIEFDYYQLVDNKCMASVNQRIKDFTHIITGYNDSIEKPLSEWYFNNALVYFEKDYQREFGAFVSSGVWTVEMSLDIDDHFTDFTQLNLTSWTYTGGAHGNGSFEVNYFSKGTGNLLELTDLFTNISELNEIGEKYFREQLELKKNEDLNEAGFWFEDGEFYLPSNFFREGDHFIFFYNQYEIAPYAAGVIEVSIPIEDLSPILLFDFD